MIVVNFFLYIMYVKTYYSGQSVLLHDKL